MLIHLIMLVNVCVRFANNAILWYQFNYNPIPIRWVTKLQIQLLINKYVFIAIGKSFRRQDFRAEFLVINYNV